MARKGKSGRTKSSVPRAHINFHYIKANQFRVIHADGVHGGLHPRGNIQMSFFSERVPIPKKVSHEIADDGRLGKEIVAERESRDGIVREVEVGVVMGVEEARALVKWLQLKIRAHEKLRDKGESS